MNFKNAIFLIESGRPLQMIKEHIADRLRVQKEINSLADELGIESATTDRRTGVLAGVVFKKEIHPDFRKPNRRDGASYPKKGSEWAKRLAAQTGWRDPEEWIRVEFAIPCSLSYKTTGGVGYSMIGAPLQACGFLFASVYGPYAMWLPDVPTIVADRLAGDDVISIGEPANSFKFEINGARRIEVFEWEYLVAKHKMDAKKSEVPA